MNPTLPELAAAYAEEKARYESSPPGDGKGFIGAELIESSLALADALLESKVREFFDEEPVTLEWLDSKGFREPPVSGSNIRWFPIGDESDNVSLVVVSRGFGSKEWVVYFEEVSEFSTTEIYVAAWENRGSLAALLWAMGGGR